MQTVTTSSTVSEYPIWPYQKIKDAILGKDYLLSLTFIGPDRARSLNKQHRKKDYIPNVLSFPLDKNVGEIYICPLAAKKEAPNFGLSSRGQVAYLFIHGCLHLKGHAHGDTMEKRERSYMRKFKIK